MKKLKLLAFVGIIGFMLSSCVVSHEVYVTDNPVGTKVGIAKATSFSPHIDISSKKAMTNGGITKIGTSDMKVTWYVLFSTYKHTVTGE